MSNRLSEDEKQVLEAALKAAKDRGDFEEVERLLTALRRAEATDPNSR